MTEDKERMRRLAIRCAELFKGESNETIVGSLTLALVASARSAQLDLGDVTDHVRKQWECFKG